MSSQYRKIKYESEGPYGSIEEKYLYIHSHDTVDVVNVYDDNGNHLFSFSETGFDMGQALVIAFTNWQDKRIEKVSNDEWNNLVKKTIESYDDGNGY
jgi:hypothetical protein